MSAELNLVTNNPGRRASPIVAFVLVLLYVLIMFSALSFFRTELAMPAGSKLSHPRSMFTVSNAATCTGFQQTVPVESYTRLGQGVILLLMVSGTLMSLIVGGAAVARVLGLPYSTMRIVSAAVVLEAGAIFVGAAILLGNKQDLFTSIFHAASAFGNCGVLIGPAGAANDKINQLLIVPLALIGGLGLTVLMEFVDWIRLGHRISRHAKAVLVATAVIYLMGTAALLALRFPSEVPTDSTWQTEPRRVLLDSSTTVLNNRTLGWPLDTPTLWPRTWVWVVMLVMLIGGSPAGTAGGLKTTTVVELCRGTVSALRGRAVSRMFGIALLWLVLYLLLIFGTSMRLLVSEPQLPSDQILFIAISAAGNVGTSIMPISITGEGLYTLSAGMMLGKILPLAVLWGAAMRARDDEIAVG